MQAGSRAACGRPATKSSCCRRGCERVASIDAPKARSSRRSRASPSRSGSRTTSSLPRRHARRPGDGPRRRAGDQARVCWLAERPLEDRARLLIKHTTRTVPARVEEIVTVVDIHTLEDTPSPGKMELNDLGVVRFRLADPLVVDEYTRNRGTGAFILIDESTNETVGAGMVVSAHG